MIPTIYFLETLGVNKTVSPQDLKKAYYGLAQKYHPDKNPSPDAKEKFAEINNAYETLSDENKRRIYDQMGLTGDQQSQAGAGADPFAGFSDFFRQAGQGGQRAGFDESTFGDFASFFNMGDQAQQSARGQDIYLSMEISFMESVQGTNKSISFEKKGVCTTCQGSKCKPGTAPGRCTNCGGRGTVNYRQGPMIIQMTCSRCRGAGVSIKNPCTTCQGVGVNRQTINETINIPKGIATGQNLRLSSKGNVSDIGTNAGDLIIKITVKPDPYFRRDGFDIITDANISISQAVLGDSIDIRTLTGTKNVKVASGSQDGDKVRLGGLGINKLPPYQNQQGDHVVNLKVQIPSKLTARQRELFEELAKVFVFHGNYQLEQRVYSSNQTQQPKEESKQESGQNEQEGGVFDKLKGIFNKS